MNFNHVSLLTGSNLLFLLHFFSSAGILLIIHFLYFYSLFNIVIIPDIKVSHTIFQLKLEFFLNNFLFEIFPYPCSCCLSFINTSKILFIYSLCSMYLNIILIDYVILCVFYLKFQILMYFFIF